MARTRMAHYFELPDYTNNLLRCGFAQADIDDSSDRLVDGIVACGGVDATLSRVQEHHDAGADHVCIQIPVADNDLDTTIGHWRRLADALDL